MTPAWLQGLSIASLVLGGCCALIIAGDLSRRPQSMWIMDVVWPLAALFGSVLTLAAYLRYGRLGAKHRTKPPGGAPAQPERETPFPMMVAKAALHCGSGCTLGDISAEWLVVLFPAIVGWLGWPGLWGDEIFAVWIVDYVLAFAFGIAFQYFTIKPMRDLSPGQAVVQAVKADALSLTAWQVGMYGFMAIAHFWLFGAVLGQPLRTASPEFWFMMQIAMLFGFATSYPVNWWLLRAGIKEKM